jgi:hypothetical protein
MKAKLVNDVLNESERLNEIWWPGMIAGLYFLYRFIKGYINNPSKGKSIEQLQQEMVDSLSDSLKTTIEKKLYVKYSEDILYHIFKYNPYISKHYQNEKHIHIIKINKQDRTLSYNLGEGPDAEFTKFPIKLSEKQYRDFIALIK